MESGKWRRQVLCLLFFFALPYPLSTIHFPFSVVLAEETKFDYNSHGKRDPFYPIVSEEGEFLSNPEQQENGVKNLLLEGIVWDPAGGSVAIINGNVVREKERIGGCEVVWIEKSRVGLRGDGEEIILMMSSQEKGE
ncbi:MAG: hypothetical protein HYS56_04335 [Candidatus Omnitrophica bacterium]|nr:hypothetical protein [Candidatus Omnitrophota bacterium]